MTFQLSPDLVEWQGTIRAFVDEDLIPWEVEAELNGGRIPEEATAAHGARARGLGLAAMDVPARHGGSGFGFLKQVVAWEQLGRVTNALSWCFSEPQRWMFEVASDSQLERYIRPLMRGEKRECYAITEEGSGSDVSDLKTTAGRRGAVYRIDGEKWFVTGGEHADFLFLQARIAGGGNEGAHGLFLVDRDAPGISVVATPHFSHTFAAHHPTLRFSGVEVPTDALLGEEGRGMEFTHAWFRRERLMIAARCCGAAERLIDEARSFAASRSVGEDTLADRQAIQFMLADSLTELWAARLMTYECAAAHDRGSDIKALHARCSMAKLFASEMAGRVADRAVQVFGGRGYMRENPAERFFRELRVERIWEGTSEIQRLIIARSLFKRGREGVLS